MMLWCGSQSGGQTGYRAGQRRQKSGGEAHRISLELVTQEKPAVLQEQLLLHAHDCLLLEDTMSIVIIEIRRSLTIVIEIARGRRRHFFVGAHGISPCRLRNSSVPIGTSKRRRSRCQGGRVPIGIK